MTTVPVSEDYQPSTLSPAYKEKDSDSEMLVKAIGLKDENGVELFDIEAEPYVSARSKASWKPSREELKKEVKRRYYDIGVKPGRVPGSSWNVGKYVAWLKDFPLTDEDAIAEIKIELEAFKAVLARDKEIANQGVQTQWKGNFVYLRLIHCFTEDEKIRAAYSRSFDALTHTELDARNSEMRKEDVYELIANKMNDPLFSPETEAFPQLHSFFTGSHTLSHKSMGNVGVVTPAKVAEKVGDMRLKLVRIITDWTKSGQGCGGKIDGEQAGKSNETEVFGDFTKVVRSGNDNRAAFLGGDSPYLLYLWQKSFEMDFLAKMVQRLDPAVAATSAQDFVSVFPSSKKRIVSPTNEDVVENNIDTKILNTLTSSTTTYERTHIRQNIYDAEKEIFLLSQELQRTNDKDGKELIKARIDQLKNHHKTLTKEFEEKGV